jgi:hypothetical protein
MRAVRGRATLTPRISDANTESLDNFGLDVGLCFQEELVAELYIILSKGG